MAALEVFDTTKLAKVLPGKFPVEGIRFSPQLVKFSYRGNDTFVEMSASTKYTIYEKSAKRGPDLHRRFYLTLKICSAYIISLALLLPVVSEAQAPQYVGISRGEMDYFASRQRNFQWCWAASIQMVLNYYGIDILQEQIVARTYGTDPRGRVPDWAGTLETILSNLNQRGTDNRGRPYSVHSRMGKEAPEPLSLIQELSRRKPVIFAYSNGPGTGHVAVVEGAVFEPSSYGPIIQSLFVRDPWPSWKNIMERGRREYAARDLASRVHFYWYITSVWTSDRPGALLPVWSDKRQRGFDRFAGAGSPIHHLGGAGPRGGVGSPRMLEVLSRK